MMKKEEAAFLQAVVEGGEDPITRLILADWLEDRGLHKDAELLRLHIALLSTCCDPDNHPERGEQQGRMIELLTRGARPHAPSSVISLSKDVNMSFTWIPPGKFLMGSPEDEKFPFSDELQYLVTISRGFYLGTHCVTQAQWQAVVGGKEKDFRTTGVSWDECQSFCIKMSQIFGLRFRLPTEAEWEYACRAGTTTPFFAGDIISTDQSNHNALYRQGKEIIKNRPVYIDSFPPNAWGLFDMRGNIWEWCQDWYGPYPNKDTKDPQGLDNGTYRVLRVGTFYIHESDVHCTTRFVLEPAYRFASTGFRIVLCTN